ncbi:predicted protein [Thalassiosira pseudonana CCMP1335]|uniref:Uncharacterized protein n=1 Tax=Thalassiosira pseudonana TaxID=35128 RepID=B8BSM9_THAPS|nr:predicted protein [Thalassiosira pseudonana CCMP1335]EED96750.1 predicted protein [Thalassiosira pseudonana CCMP1335]
MIFDFKSTSSNNLVIVPPKPDAILMHHDEFSYGNLYCYDDTSCGVATSSVGWSSSSSGSNESSSSSAADRDREEASFDASAFREITNMNDALANDNGVSTAPSATKTSTNATSNVTSNNASLAITRDPRNGAFTFQVHAEYDLLLYVQKDLDRVGKRRGSGDVDGGSAKARLSDVESARAIMTSVDNYCLRKQWMYHIGAEKANAISHFLKRSLHDFVQRHSSTLLQGSKATFHCVELGTYCGYSAIVLATALCTTLQELRDGSSGISTSSGGGDNNIMMAKAAANVDFHIYTTEISSKLLNVAQSMFRLAKMEKYITPILMGGSTGKKGDSGGDLSSVIKNYLGGGDVGIDFLLLDHAKNLYLTDLTDLENVRLLKAGSLDAYRDHMRLLAREGIAETFMEEMNLEYSNNLKDGMGSFPVKRKIVDGLEVRGS